MEAFETETMNLALYQPPTLINFTVPYDVSARGYFNRSYNLFPEGAKNRALLIYCALELRFAIERALFEYMTVVSAKKGWRVPDELYSAKPLKSAILKVEPDFIWKLKFMNLVYEAHGLGAHQMTIPDLDLTSRYYGHLCGHLHFNRLSTATSALSTWEDLYLLIEEIHDKLWPYVAEPRLQMDFNEVALALLADFKGGRKTDREIVELLRGDSSETGYGIATLLRNFIDHA